MDQSNVRFNTPIKFKTQKQLDYDVDLNDAQTMELSKFLLIFFT